MHEKHWIFMFLCGFFLLLVFVFSVAFSGSLVLLAFSLFLIFQTILILTNSKSEQIQNLNKFWI
jgi:hypothetical protein